MKTTRLNGWLWLYRVLGWDGLLPLSVILLPIGVGAVMPNKADAICFVAVAAPIIALTIRFYIGRRTIALNCVGPIVHMCQYCVFTAAIFALLFWDFVLILTHLGPQVRFQVFYVMGAIYALYLAAMSFAMFPGWIEVPPTQNEELSTSDPDNLISPETTESDDFFD